MSALPTYLRAVSFVVASYGYDSGPEFSTLEEARVCLANQVAAALQAARRKSEEARKHKLSEDCYRITLGSDKDSTLWAAISIVPQ